MQQRKQHTAFAVDGYAITASFADCKNAAALHHVKQILLSSFANNTAKNSSGDILAIPPEQRDNNSGGSPYLDLRSTGQSQPQSQHFRPQS